MNTLPGSDDTATKNVPLHLGGDVFLHYEGREGDRPVVRIAGRQSGPSMPWAGVDELVAYVATVAALMPAVATEGVADWLEDRMAEPARTNGHGDRRRSAGEW